MGSVGENPILQVGGLQDAITAEAPREVAFAVPTPPKRVLVPPVAVTEAEFEELQVKGTPVIVLPRVSSTVALIVVEVPVGTTNDVLLLFGTARVMVWTAQVTKLKG